MARWASVAAAISAGIACGGDEPEPKRVPVEGDVLEFLKEVPGPRVVGAKVSVLEHPERSFVTGEDAHFALEANEGEDFTLLVEHEGFKTTQTATMRPGPNGIAPFSVQVVSNNLYILLSAVVPLRPELDKYCAVATTTARMGGSLYVRLRQGMPGVRVALDPPVPAESGPIYFNEDVLPDPAQQGSSIDGGVLFYRVPPGDYRMTASKDGNVFNSVRIQCRAGMIVNAGPPLGVLANVPQPDYGLGKTRADDAYSAASDAMCETTRRCVNERAKVENYPEATLASCKAMFRNTWAFVDDACDASTQVRDAARAVYACRATSCAIALGDDDVCVAEEAAFRTAEASYGACLAGASSAE